MSYSLFWPIQACPRQRQDRPVVRILSIVFLYAVPRADGKGEGKGFSQCMVAGWGGGRESFCFRCRTVALARGLGTTGVSRRRSLSPSRISPTVFACPPVLWSGWPASCVRSRDVPPFASPSLPPSPLRSGGSADRYTQSLPAAQNVSYLR